LIRYRPMKKARALVDLSQTVDMMETEQMAQALENRMVRQDRQITWIHWQTSKPSDTADMLAEVIVDPQGDNSTLMRFMGFIDETLFHAETYGSILRTAYSSDGCVSLTIIIKTDKLNRLVSLLGVKPEVEAVEEKKAATPAVLENTRKFRGIPVAENDRPRRKIDVKLAVPAPTVSILAV
jgi:hypothetical protein